jgi:hypothetical protein
MRIRIESLRAPRRAEVEGQPHVHAHRRCFFRVDLHPANGVSNESVLFFHFVSS